GPRIGYGPVKSIVQCLAKKEGKDDFYKIKILTLEKPEDETYDDRQGKMLMHTEYSILSLLHNQTGVEHHHGLFKVQEKEVGSDRRQTIVTGKIQRRLCLVLDCLIPHDYSTRTNKYVNLQHHVITERRLSESYAILIFTDIIRVVESLHKKNIVHRDLKLGNMVLDKDAKKIIITNFCLGRHLVSENEMLTDQRGSPAYISPDVLSYKPYLGKPSDMWALGVVLYTLFFGRVPFFDTTPQELFRKIKAVEFTIPNDVPVSENSIMVIRKLLVLDPKTRMTASQVLDAMSVILSTRYRIIVHNSSDFHVVPDIDINKLNKAKSEQGKTVSHNMPFSYNTQYHEHSSNFQQILQTVNSECSASTSTITCRSRRTGPPPIKRLHTDAQPLTPSEIAALHHAIPKV
ncbi:hypothetical protein LOTGIDRAFT_108566, partial [Lottia gigantea]